MKKNFFLIFWLNLFFTTMIFSQGFENFITVSGSKLMDGTNEYRFISFNIPNLNFVEDEMAFTTVSPYRLPTEFEIRDALLSVKQMGGRVVRIYTIPVKRLDEPADVPAHVLGPDKFNEEAYKVNDLMLALANEIGIRIIFPIVNNWKWMGGRPQYAAFRGKGQDDFWTDPQLIDDVKKTIEFTLNRTNTITGIKYKDDKAILCWETGNELTCPHSWTKIITSYIKQLDKNHLVMDGFYAINKRTVHAEAIDEPSVDILSSHHYETDPAKTLRNIQRNLDLIKGKKPLVIGEFGFQGTIGLENTMDMIISDHGIAGGLIWSLRHHREEGGFYWHSEPAGMGIYKAYHWPGFSSGDLYDERNFLQLMKRKAFEIRGEISPEIEIPLSPSLLPINEVYNINWQGSAGALFYNVERADNAAGPWETVAFHIDDTQTQYSSLFHDATAEKGKSYYYRVIAGNEAGLSVPSNIVGPVEVEQQALSDDMEGYGVIYRSQGITMETRDDRKYKEDMNRAGGKRGSEITYLAGGAIQSVKVYSFEKASKPVLTLSISADGQKFEKAEVATSCYAMENEDYKILNPVLYEITSPGSDAQFVKIEFKGVAKISKVEIVY